MASLFGRITQLLSQTVSLAVGGMYEDDLAEEEIEVLSK
jgi:hypothetical protein